MPFQIRRIAIRSRFFALAAFVAACVNGLWIDSAQAGERWTDLYGKHTIEADFVGLWGDTVVLQMSTGKRVSVAMDQLIAESRIQARQLEEEQKKRRSETRSLIEDDAKKAAAPAPDPLPEPPPVAAYSPYTGSGDLLSNLQWQAQQMRNGHVLLVTFDSLPPSYQDDVERLLKQSVAKLDLAGANQVIRSVHSIGELIVTRQRWVFSYPRLKNMDEVNKDLLQKVLLSIGGMIRDGLDPDELQLAELPNQPLRTWIKNIDDKMAPYIASLGDLKETLGIPEVSFNVTQEQNGAATVETSFGAISQPTDYLLVEDKWVPVSMSKEAWAESTKSWDAWLAETPDASVPNAGQATAATLVVDGFVQSALSATNSRELHAQFDTLIAGVTPMLSQVANMGMGMGNNRQNGYGGSGDQSGYSSYEEGMDQSGSDPYEQEMQSGSSSYSQ
ncbi:hypothetical protein LOC67_01580 [Stieleria sp. JC731]|uniref:hypothetical protein n=1 Tax=Pirellulaceae TaxID=2691357 RepID=UPI001E3863C8|nr:hypothetical protein [Stieleria sp. JC731]MCC9599233.1 hypothetical protein [Stieleria sp. JC731]